MAASDVDEAMSDVIFSCSSVVMILAVTPWAYVWWHYVTAEGDAWRGTAGLSPKPLTTRGRLRHAEGTARGACSCLTSKEVLQEPSPSKLTVRVPIPITRSMR